MSEDKLQALLTTLKKQGLESGEQLGREKVEAANKDAEAILAQAREQAGKIVSEAREEADRQMRRLQSSLEIAALKYVNQLKQQAEENLLRLPLKKEMEAKLGKADFIKAMVLSVVEAYTTAQKGAEVQVHLPLATSDEVVAAISSLIKKHGQKDGDHKVVVKDPSLKLGFAVDIDNGHVRLDFSDESFLAEFLAQLSPEFRKYFSSLDLQAEAGK
jgi:V/A-type H+-transporting ATPase subunit E